MRILLVEQDPVVCDLLAYLLRSHDYIVDQEHDAAQGIYKIFTKMYDAIVIDYHLYENQIEYIGNKLEKERIDVPFFVSMAEHDEELESYLFSIGADECLKKPFSFNCFNSRLMRSLRKKNNLPTLYNLDTLCVDSRTGRVTRGEREIQLRNKERQVLNFLIQNQDRVLSRYVLLQHVWQDFTAIMTNTVDVHLSALHRKIDLPGEKRLIHTVYGIGFKFSLAK